MRGVLLLLLLVSSGFALDLPIVHIGLTAVDLDCVGCINLTHIFDYHFLAGYSQNLNLSDNLVQTLSGSLVIDAANNFVVVDNLYSPGNTLTISNVNTTSGNLVLSSASGSVVLGAGTNSLSNTDSAALTIDPSGSNRINFHGSTYYLDSSGVLNVGAITATGLDVGAGTVAAGVVNVDNVRLDGNSLSSTLGELVVDSFTNFVVVPDSIYNTGSMFTVVGINTTGVSDLLINPGGNLQFQSSSYYVDANGVFRAANFSIDGVNYLDSNGLNATKIRSNNFTVSSGIYLDGNELTCSGCSITSSSLTTSGLITGSNGLTISAGSISLPANSIASSAVNFNYAGSSTKGGSATTALDLSCIDCIGTTEIADSYVLNTGDTMAGALTLSVGGAALQIVGSSDYPEIKISDGGTSKLRLGVPSTAGYILAGSTAGAVVLGNDNGVLQLGGGSGGTSTVALTIDSSGQVGIGDTTPSYKLDVNGDARVTGSITAGSFSVSSSQVVLQSLVCYDSTTGVTSNGIFGIMDYDTGITGACGGATSPRVFADYDEWVMLSGTIPIDYVSGTNVYVRYGGWCVGSGSTSSTDVCIKYGDAGTAESGVTRSCLSVCQDYHIDGDWAIKDFYIGNSFGAGDRFWIQYSHRNTGDNYNLNEISLVYYRKGFS